MLRKILIIHLLVFLLIQAQSGEKSDFLIVENPQALTIYDKYQQSLEQGQLSSFPQYVPYRIIEPLGTFSDGLRKYVKVEFDSDEYFLLAEKENKPLSSLEFGKSFLLRNKSVFKDTIDINLNNKLLIRFPDSQQKIYLNSGDRLLRIFKDVTEYYIYSFNLDRYGWARFPAELEGNVWEKHTTGLLALSVGYGEIIERVREKTEEYNKVILSLFRHLNNKTDKNLAMPYWAINEQDNYTDVQFVNHQNSFSESVKEMREEIKKIISISSFSYEQFENGIRIIRN
ncbi:MAG: hypothetical protein SCALA702_16740 [Melioribacteraceae bacterium]|nr:MAG: hypothetical protein SCALA702_16740 [Melioribacteraceae bacterium]